MLVRNEDGRWLRLEETSGLPLGGFGAMCGDGDLAPLLGLTDPHLVAAINPAVAGNPDALCLTPEGGVSLVVSFFEQPVDGAMFRLLECAGALVGMTLDDFAPLCGQVDADSPGAWVAALAAAGGDAAAIDAAIAATLASGSFELLAVASGNELDRLDGPLRYLAASGAASVRCFELVLHAAGNVQAVEAREVAVGAGPGRVHSVRQALPSEAVETPVEQAAQRPETAIDTAVAAAAAAADTGSRPVRRGALASASARAAAGAADASEDEAADTPPAEDNVTAVDMQAAIAAANDDKLAALIQRLVTYSTTFFDDVTFASDGDTVVMQSWVDDGDEQVVLLELASDGQLTVLFDGVPELLRADLAAGLGRILPEFEVGETGHPDRLQVAIAEQLNDETLMDFFIETLSDSLHGLGADAADEASSGEPAIEDGSPGIEAQEQMGDFFAEMQAGIDTVDLDADRHSLVRVDDSSPGGHRASAQPGRLEPLHR